jgi:hypothetical protein
LGVASAQDNFIDLVCTVELVLNCLVLHRELRSQTVTQDEIKALAVTNNATDIIFNADLSGPFVVLYLSFGQFCQSKSDFILELSVNCVV